MKTLGSLALYAGDFLSPYVMYTALVSSNPQEERRLGMKASVAFGPLLFPYGQRPKGSGGELRLTTTELFKVPQGGFSNHEALGRL